MPSLLISQQMEYLDRDVKTRSSDYLFVCICVCVHCKLMCGQDKETVLLATYYTILYVVAKNKFIEKRLSVYVGSD